MLKQRILYRHLPPPMITKHVQSMSRYTGQKVLLCNIIIDQNRKMVRDDNDFSRYTGIHSFGTCNID